MDNADKPRHVKVIEQMSTHLEAFTLNTPFIDGINMRILVTGASGFIATQIITDLIIKGHDILCCARDTSYTQSLFPNATTIACDFLHDTNPDIWINRLHNVDIVINCAGVLYHPKSKVVWAIHYETPKALFQACVTAGIQRIIQISALGIDKSDVVYSASKKAADDYLLQLPIPSIILRPSLVYGRGSYGGSSLFRGLAGLPFVTPVPGKGLQEFQPILLNDLSNAIVHLIDKPISNSLVLHAVSEQRVNLKNILIQLRSWLGFRRSKLFHVPLILIRLGAFLGDCIPYSTLNSVSYKMMAQDSITTPEETRRFAEQIGLTPQNFTEGLHHQPSTVQDHWHAKLYFLKFPLRISIAFVWVWTALSCLFFYPQADALRLLTEAGIPSEWQKWLYYSSIILDGLLGFAMLFNRQIKKVVALQIFTIITYTIIISLTLPFLWLEPFAPIAKNIPLIISTLVYLAMESDR